MTIFIRKGLQRVSLLKQAYMIVMDKPTCIISNYSYFPSAVSALAICSPTNTLQINVHIFGETLPKKKKNLLCSRIFFEILN